MFLANVMAASRRRFDPLSLSPALWLSDTGSSAGTWPDISGNGRDATQSTAASQPAIITNALNGRQVRRFDGSDDWLSVDSLSSFFNGDDTPISLICCASSAGSSSLKAILSSGNSSGVEYFNWFGQNADEITRFDRRSILSNDTSNTGGSSWTSISIVSYVFSGTQINAFLNGSSTISAGSANTGTFGNNTNRVSVGALVRSSTALFWPGDIAEILVFPTALSTENRQSVERYLSNKWNIALA